MMQYHKLIDRVKTIQGPARPVFNSQPMSSLEDINSLLHRKHTTSLPSTIPEQYLAETFASFFSVKVFSIRFKMSSNLSPIPSHFNQTL